MLKIKNITANIGDITVVKDISLEINKGEIHAIVGPKKSGKSSIVHAILGNPILDIKGSILFKGKSILKKNISQRNQLGIYTTFQYLPLLEGITNLDLATAMLKAHKDQRNANQIEKEYKKLLQKLGLSSNHGHKVVNDETMTPSECKKNEVLHMILQDPELIVLDELDHDVEEDELEIFATTIKEFLTKKKSAIVISHNKQFLDILNPTHVHVVVNGGIVEQGEIDLYKRITENGYPQLS